MYERILYWKWDDSLLDPATMKAKVDDLFARAHFELVYISLHHIHLPFHDPEIIKALERFSELLAQHGARFMVDVELRNEGKSFFEKYPGSRAGLTRSVELGLDDEGNGSIDIVIPQREHFGRDPSTAPPCAILQAWAFHPLPDRHFADDSLACIKHCVFMEQLDASKVRFVVKAGKQQAGKRAILFPAVTHAIPDLFSPAMYEYYSFMFDKIRHLPLAGVANDEWGYDLCLQFDTENNKIFVAYFPYSPYLAALYEKQTGRKLEDDLLYLRYAPASRTGRSVQAINDYIGAVRAGMKANNDFFYQKGKETFGPDTFIGVHPTLWGDPLNYNFDVLLNGLDWWEVKRDYAQTDESVLFPTRFALQHKWGGKYWYNMFYSGGTLKLETYFAETWLNARYGGRTHYHGYECPNEGVVLELRQPGCLEKIAEMENVVAKLNEFQESVPDCRVLVVFGMEAATNWRIYDPNQEHWGPGNPIMRDASLFAKQLFESGYLCDFVPSSEIANGDVKMDGTKARYGNQVYDALIMLYPEAIDRKVLDFLENYAETNGQLLVMGGCTMFRDGSDAGTAFNRLTDRLRHYYPEPVSIAETIRILRQWGVPKNTVPQGCILQDGSVILTADGKQASGNPLKVEFELKGRKISVECEDFFALKLHDDGTVQKYAGHRIKSFAIDGRSAL